MSFTLVLAIMAIGIFLYASAWIYSIKKDAKSLLNRNKYGKLQTFSR